MKISIIVTTCGDSKDYLKLCLDSIFKFTSMINTEVIVVANGCTEVVREYLKTKTVQLLWFEERIGYVSAVNEGIKISKGEYIVLLNDDTIVLGSDWIDIFTKPFLDDQKVGITGPLKFTWNCGGIQRAAIGFFCVMIKRKLFDELGLLDTIFNPGMGEDGDFSIKAEKAGYRLVQVPTEDPKEFGDGVAIQNFPIYHKGNGTFSADVDGKNKIIDRNTKILAERYGLKKDILESIYTELLNNSSDINQLFPTLRKYASLCSHITEFGVRDVVSTYAFLASRPRKMVSYDIYTSANIPATLDIAKVNEIDFKFIEQSTLETTIEETDLLFIDTVHSYGQLSEELRLHANKVKKYILMHDTTFCGEIDSPATNSIKQGLNIAISEFLLAHKEWSMIEKIEINNGLTVLERKSTVQVSIVIPTLNHLEDGLKPCLEAVLKYTDLTDKEIIVVPNGCTDGTMEYLQSLGDKIKIISFDKPMGYIIPVNMGVRSALGKYVVLLSNDCHLLPQKVDTWINIMLSPFLADDNVGVAGPLGYIYPGLGLAIHGGCVMYKKEAWDKVGGYDTLFGYGYISDVDMSLRINDSGYKAVFVHEDGYAGSINTYHIDFPLYTTSKVVTMDRQADALLVGKNRALTSKRHKGKPSISIVIPTCNRLETLKVCLDRIFMYTDCLEKEIIVVPNGCTDGTLEYLETLKDYITIRNIPEASGHVIPTNAGAEIAKGGFIVLLDDDSMLLPQKVDTWIRLLYVPFEADKSVGATGVFASDYPYLGIALHSGCAMYRRDVWDKVGGGDLAFGFGYLYDADLSLRIKELGYKTLGVGENNAFPLYHPESPVTSNRKQEDVALIRKNRNILYERHGKKPRYSIVIPTYNHLEDCLKPCLNSIVQHTNLEDVEVIVVANGCNEMSDSSKKEKTAEFVDSLGHPFKLVWFDEGLGFTKATNEGIKVALGDYIILLNNDTVLLEKGQPKNAWIEMLVFPFLRDDKVGITGPLELYDTYADSKVMIFFCVMIKKELFNKIGLLDESYSPGGGEDIDFCIKAKMAGYKEVVVPDYNMDFTFTNVGQFPIYHLGEGTFTEKEWPEYSKKIIKDNGTKNMIRYNKHIKLNVGSGGIEVPGYISVDKYDTRAHILMDAFDLNLPENSVEEILASHLFEHISPYRSLDLLKKWLKVLKPGGKLIMELPNIEELCKDFVTGDKSLRYGILNCIYGAVNTTNEGTNEDITSPHLWGWYPEIMYDHLAWAGFINIRIMPEQMPHPHKNFRVEAVKNWMTSEEMLLYNNGERLIPGVTHDNREYLCHLSAYNFFKETILADGNSGPISIVDLGCGVGWGSPILASIPNSVILGIDISKECIDYANKHYPANNVRYQKMSIEDFINSDLKFDYVVSSEVIEHMNNLSVLSQVKYNKKLLLGMPYKEQPGKNIHHKLFDLKEDNFKDFYNVKFSYSDFEGKITSVPGTQSINFLVAISNSK